MADSLSKDKPEDGPASVLFGMLCWLVGVLQMFAFLCVVGGDNLATHLVGIATFGVTLPMTAMAAVIRNRA